MTDFTPYWCISFDGEETSERLMYKWEAYIHIEDQTTYEHVKKLLQDHCNLIYNESHIWCTINTNDSPLPPDGEYSYTYKNECDDDNLKKCITDAAIIPDWVYLLDASIIPDWVDEL